MITRLKDTFWPGGWGPGAEWFNMVARKLNNMRCRNGDVDNTPDFIEIIPNMRGLDGRNSFSSWSFAGTDGAQFAILGGTIRWAGRGLKTFDDGTTVEITGGSAVAPGYVSLRVMAETTDMSETELVFTTSYPEEDGTYMYRVLHSAYLDDTEAVYVRDLRHDIALGSPI